ncbi:hypothetical protein AQS70_21090 [Pseudomonas endophytica]|uniref:Uncharacterized protein n=1 Tax=Pseudomonas endophytica TaxID=1563157 RepID=A0A0Q0YYA5_9PSED|nr:hypothetical protein [Pseudomonas endophytica]KQB54646.1 hypothetical protein AQS70_21090 [Pseudomonas endophytica]
MSAHTELAVVPAQETALAVYSTPNGLEPWLQKVRAEVDAFNQCLPDLATVKGRKQYASMAYKIAQTKTALDDMGKKVSAEQKEIPKKIDAERKRVWDTLELWQKEVRKPLDDWQKAEDARVDKHNDGIQKIRDMALFDATPQAVTVAGVIADLETITIDDSWQEFLPEAAQAKDLSLTKLRALLAERTQYEAEQAELARLRAEAEAQAQRDRDAEIARAAAERARVEAEQRAQAERDAAIKREADAKAAAERREMELKLVAEHAERAAAQAAREKIEAEQRAAQQKIDDELRHKQQMEQAEANRIAAEQRAEQERLDAVRRQEEAVERARQAEVARQQAAADEERRQAEAREADKAHKAKINRAALDAFIAAGMPEDCARQAITLIAQRKIPAITITY